MSFRITLAQPKDGQPVELIVDKPADFKLVGQDEDRGSGRFYFLFYETSPGEPANPMEKVVFTAEGRDDGREHWVMAFAVIDNSLRSTTRNRIRDNREH